VAHGRIAAGQQGGEPGGRGAGGGRDDGRFAGERLSKGASAPGRPQREEHEEHLVDRDAEQGGQYERVVKMQRRARRPHRQQDRGDDRGDGEERDGRLAQAPQREPEREGEQGRGERERARQLVGERRAQRRLEARVARQGGGGVDRGDEAGERAFAPLGRVDVGRHQRLAPVARDVAPRDQPAQRAHVDPVGGRPEVVERLGEALGREPRPGERLAQGARARGQVERVAAPPAAPLQRRPRRPIAEGVDRRDVARAGRERLGDRVGAQLGPLGVAVGDQDHPGHFVFLPKNPLDVAINLGRREPRRAHRDERVAARGGAEPDRGGDERDRPGRRRGAGLGPPEREGDRGRPAPRGLGPRGAAARLEREGERGRDGEDADRRHHLADRRE
jgi:hypothetical protein